MAVKRRKRSTTIYHVKKGATRAAVDMLSAVSLFVLLVSLTLIFIFVQWKNVAVRQTLENITRLEKEVRLLNSRRIQLETRRNELMKRIPHIAMTRLGMEPIENPKILTVDGKKLYGDKQ